MGLQPAMRTISLLLARGRQRDTGELPGSQAADSASASSVASVAAASVVALGDHAGVQLAFAAGLERLREAGLSGWESITAGDEEAAVAAAGRVGYPVAMKWDGNIAHRARVGGVALGLKNAGEVREAWHAAH